MPVTGFHWFSIISCLNVKKVRPLGERRRKYTGPIDEGERFLGTDWERAKRPLKKTFSASDFRLTALSKPEPGAWFLGPKGENLDPMRALLTTVLDAHAKGRAAFHEDDPPFIGTDVTSSIPFKDTIDGIRENLDLLSMAMRSSTPMSSYRNQSHMNWDISMSGALGYFAGMLYNSNNVAPEASPVTTSLELQVGRDLCTMLGYGETPTPWGHITCGGSIANAESMWAARNLRYQAAALARAIRLEEDLKAARSIAVTKGDGGRALLLDLEPWDLVNLPNEVILDLPQRLVDEAGLTGERVAEVLDVYSVQAMGLAAFQQEVLQGLHLGVVLVPATAHYSWDKAVTILGLGAQALRRVEVDVDARMSVPSLRAELERCVQERVPVIQLVAVAGSTAESAVDPLAEIAAAREEYQWRGLSLALHADAAWGGYFASTLIAPKSGGDTMTPVEKLSPYTTKQLGALHHADTITVDPHKSGYVPYPAGALCYRDQRMTYLVAHRSPVVDHSDDVPNVGSYGIEGSKPGAAAAGVAMTHATIPLDRSGYGELLGRCAWNAKMFYIGIGTLRKDGDPFIAVPVKQLPSEARGASKAEVDAERAMLAPLLHEKNEDIVDMLKADETLAKSFSELGPDLTVLSYAFNFLEEDGTPNTDLARMNALNLQIFEKMSVEEVSVADQPPDIDMLVTSTVVQPSTYGTRFMESMIRRSGVDAEPADDRVPLRVLISTTMNPWLTDTTDGSFLPVLMDIMRDTVLTARAEILNARA